VLKVIWCLVQGLRGLAVVLHLASAQPCAAAVLLAAPVADPEGTHYYVDADRGSDAYSGTLAEPDADETDGPLRTIQAACDRLEAGDCVWIRRGVYRETVTLRIGASESSPVVVQAFPGDEGKVVILAADPIRNWKPCPSEAFCGGNANWTKICYADVDAEIQQLFQGGSRLKQARYPDRGWQFPASADPVDPNRSFLDGRLPKGGVYTGGTCNVRTSPWHIDQIPIHAYDADKGRVTLASPTRYPLSLDTGYSITNLVSEINEEGEWAIDRQQNRVYLWPLGESPEDIEATVRENGIRAVQGCSYHTIRGLAVRCAARGIELSGTRHVAVRENTIEYSYYVGILDSNSAYSTLAANTIRYAGYIGIEEDGLCTHGLIEGNTVYATGAEKLGDDPVWGNALGIGLNGRRTRVLRNRIDRSGHHGLYAGRGETSGREIAYNYITNSCLLLSDGAGIYADGRSSTTDPDVFHHNIVADVWGWRGGWAGYDGDPAESPDLATGEGYGIYLDEQGSNRVFERNTALHCRTAGMFFHWTQDNRLAQNTLYGNGEVQILFAGRDDPRYALRNNLTEGNLLIATSPSQKTLHVHLDEGDVTFGSSDRNRFFHPQGPRHILVCQDPNGRPCTAYSLAQWRAVSGQDGESKDRSPSGEEGASPVQSVLFANPSDEPTVVHLEDRDYVDIEGMSVAGQVSLGPFESIVLFPTAAE